VVNIYIYVAQITIFFYFGLQTEDVFNEIDFCFSYLADRFYLPVLRLFLTIDLVYLQLFHS